MELEGLFGILSIFENSLAVTVIPLITIILIRKLIIEKKETGNLNVIRLLIIGAFASFSWLLVWEFLFDLTAIDQIIPRELYGQDSDRFSIYNFGLGLIVTFGLTIWIYINRLEYFYYTPFFFYIGMFTFYLITGFSDWLMPYFYITGVVDVFFLYFTGFKVKDNGSLGMAIIFTLAILTLFSPNPLIGFIINFSYLGFGIIFAFGKFKPFKEHGIEVENNVD